MNGDEGIGKSEIGFGNFGTLHMSAMGIGSMAFLFLIMVCSGIWKYFVGLGIDQAWAQTYINLSVISFLLFTFLTLLALFLTRQVRFVPGVPFGKIDVVSIGIILIVSFALSGIFSFTALTFAPFSFIPLSVYSLEQVTEYVASQFQIFTFLVNYAIIPAFDEEIFIVLLMVFMALILNIVFNNRGDKATALKLNILAIIIGISVFGLFHYDAYGKDLTKAWNNYQANPTFYVEQHPTEPIPVDPKSVAYIGALFTSLFMAAAFKLANSGMGIFFDAFWIMINSHFLNNAFLLVFNKNLVTYGAFPQLILLELLIIMLIFLQAAFERSISVGQITFR